MQKRRIRYSSIRQRGDTRKWLGRLTGYPVFILGNGPSLNDEDISSLSNFFTIGINRSFYKLDSTILMWQDSSFWYTERHKIIETKAIKYCTASADPENRYYHFKINPVPFSIPENTLTLNGYGSTSPLAFQLAYLLGCNPIILLGCDCKHRNGDTDFYGKNKFHNSKTMSQCYSGLNWISTIKDRTVISCSDNDLFQRVSLSSILFSLDNKYKQNRDYWNQFLL